MFATGKTEALTVNNSGLQSLKLKLYENRWWIAYALTTFLVFALPKWSWGHNFGYAAWTCSLAVAVAVHSFWTVRTRLWFRLAVAFILSVHVAVLSSIHWTNHRYLGATYRSMGEVDFVVTFALLWLMQKIATFASATSSLKSEASLHDDFGQSLDLMHEDKGLNAQNNSSVYRPRATRQ